MISAHRYRILKPVIARIPKEKSEKLEKYQEKILEAYYKAEDIRRVTFEGSESIRQAARDTLRFTPEFQNLEKHEEDEKGIRDAFGNSSNFVQIHASFSNGIFDAWKRLKEISTQLTIPEIESADDGDDNLSSRERLVDMSAEYQLNGHSVGLFSDACEDLSVFRYRLTEMTQHIRRQMEAYFNNLTERHSKLGLEVWHTPILTDFALTIFENVRHHGEISKETADTEISAYSKRKAIELISWIKDERFKEILLNDTSLFSYHLRRRLRDISAESKKLETLFSDEMEEIASTMHRRLQLSRDSAFDSCLMDLEDMDPNRVKFRDLSAAMTEEERHELQFKNEVVGGICRMLKDDKSSPQEIADYVWEKCKILRKHYLEENSFYQCRIAQGNPNLGKGSGHLEIVPGKKPYASFDRLSGSGFGEVKKFVAHIASLKKWGPLFLITSPRKSIDRANVLLIGPQGSGKTECMRAVANEDDCIAIFAQGSDFLTAWMGEAQKNPKRLFEAAIKLHKDSGRHVHILIDEIDSVLNNNWTSGQINLSLEFQMIMDGIVDYPGISVWGTTNHPEKIPMPMIRRFSLVSIVGKLDQEQRVHLLKQFMAVLPLSDSFTESTWSACATKLEGATGDVVRKVCDYVWRTEIARFIEEEPEDAEDMLNVLSRLSRDKHTGKKVDNLENREADLDPPKRSWTDESTKRDKFLKAFSKVFVVEPEVLEAAVEVALSNIGIINEIATAKQSYADAEVFLAQVKEERDKNATASPDTTLN